MITSQTILIKNNNLTQKKAIGTLLETLKNIRNRIFSETEINYEQLT